MSLGERKILFANVPFALRKGTCSNYLANLSNCVTVTTRYLRLHLWKQSYCHGTYRELSPKFAIDFTRSENCECKSIHFAGSDYKRSVDCG